MRIIKTISGDGYPGSTITVTGFDEETGGLACSATCSTISERGKYYFNRLITQPKHRNKGYAGKILDTLLDIFKEKDFELQLDINPYGDLDYLQLESFYIKHGFMKYEVHDNTFGTFYTYYYNKKEV